MSNCHGGEAKMISKKQGHLNIQLECVGFVQINFLHLPKPSAEFVTNIKTCYKEPVSSCFPAYVVSLAQINTIKH